METPIVVAARPGPRSLARPGARGDPRARPADRGSPPPPLGPAGRALPVRGAARRHRLGPRHPRHRLRAVPVHVPRRRAGGAAPGRRDRVRRRRRGAERQRAVRTAARLRRHRRHGGPDAGRRGRAGAGGAPPRGRRPLARHPQLDRLARLGRGAVEPDQAAAGAADGARLPPRRRAAPRRRALARRLGLPHPARRGDRPRARLPRHHDRARPLRRHRWASVPSPAGGRRSSGPGARTSARSPHARTWS